MAASLRLEHLSPFDPSSLSYVQFPLPIRQTKVQKRKERKFIKHSRRSGRESIFLCVVVVVFFKERVLAVRLFVFVFVFVCRLANKLSKFNNERNFAAH